MPNKADLSATLAGGAAGFILLQSVKWENVYGGDTTKVVIALILIIAGCLIYRGAK
jgi:hypothetical protein